MQQYAKIEKICSASGTTGEDMRESIENKGLNSYWLQWFVESNGDYLESSQFKLVQLPQTTSSIPLILLKDLNSRQELLSILRTKNHIPKDPYELVSFIQSLEEFNWPN